MKVGRLGFNPDNGRYGLLVMDLWEKSGFCCGEKLEVLVDGEWTPTRMEMASGGIWYLVGTPFRGEGLEFVKARI